MKVLNSAQFIVLEINIDIIINEVQNISMLSVFLNVHMCVCEFVCGVINQPEEGENRPTDPHLPGQGPTPHPPVKNNSACNFNSNMKEARRLSHSPLQREKI